MCVYFKNIDITFSLSLKKLDLTGKSDLTGTTLIAFSLSLFEIFRERSLIENHYKIP